MEETRKPTAEQQDGLDKFLTRKQMRVGAYAGCGKTTMLQMLGRSTDRRGAYICFNADGAKEAKPKFEGTNVTPSTTHGLAFRAMVKAFGPEKLTGGLNGGFLAARMGLPTIDVAADVTLSPRGHGALVLDTIKRYCSSDKDHIEPWHVPFEGRLDDRITDAKDRRDLAVRIAVTAQRTWERMCDPRNDLPLTHDGYLKLWALSRPTIPGEFIFLDEAQDSSNVVLGVLKHQSAQLVAVGDKHQQIYEWRGAVNAMTALPCEVEAQLTTSWRFGPKIAEHATEILRLLGEPVPMKGNPGRQDRLAHLDRPNAILCRTNAELIEQVMSAVEAEKRPFVLGGTAQIMTYVDAAEKLQAGKPADRPLEFFGFRNWREVVAASQDEDGADLRRWVKLVESYGTDRLRQVLDNLPKQSRGADMTITTGHKSKGKEWDSVRLRSDFLKGVKTPEEEAEAQRAAAAKGKPYKPATAEDKAAELRLLYVAATRGMTALEMHPELTLKLQGLGANVTPLEAPPATVTTAPATVAAAAEAPPTQSVSIQPGEGVKKAPIRLKKTDKDLIRRLLAAEAAKGCQQASAVLAKL